MLALSATFSLALTTPPLRAGPPTMTVSASSSPPASQLLSGCVLPRVSDGAKVDLGELLAAPITTMLVLGTYPADFNMIEYAQKMRHYWPQLQAKGVDLQADLKNALKAPRLKKPKPRPAKHAPSAAAPKADFRSALKATKQATASAAPKDDIIAAFQKQQDMSAADIVKSWVK